MPITTVVTSRLTAFTAMSAALTGFTADTIAPSPDPINLTQAHLDQADKSGGQAIVDQLLAQFALLVERQPAQQIADALLGIVPSSSGPTVQLARSLVKLWYLGSWYPPESTNAFAGTTVSQNGYIGGLAWRAMQAHPMGYSEFAFGYWSEPPLSLEDLGVDVPPGDKS
jgi:hypothetical protein